MRIGATCGRARLIGTRRSWIERARVDPPPRPSSFPSCREPTIFKRTNLSRKLGDSIAGATEEEGTIIRLPQSRESRFPSCDVESSASVSFTFAVGRKERKEGRKEESKISRRGERKMRMCGRGTAPRAPLRSWPALGTVSRRDSAPDARLT